MSTEATAAVIDLDLERLVHLDQQVDANESRALRTRWEFGHQMLAARDGAGRLPNGYLAALVERTGKSRSELGYRVQFAAAFPTEAELSNALDSFPSWREVTKNLKAEKDADDNTVSEPPVIPEGKFATFVADPPWRYGNTSTRGAAENHYPTMSIEELCELDVVREHAAEQAHLYMWTTAGHLPEAFKVMEAWGFEYKTYLVWTKPQMGMGNYFRVSTELVLFGIRGGLRTQTRNTMNYFDAPRQKHSAKPPLFHDLVAKNSPGPFMELFSRCQADTMLTGCQCSKCRLGWTVWGNQS
ncbi:MAG TPA: MT-A70 family methyltransferase [Jiangellaceae bacterium]